MKRCYVIEQNEKVTVCELTLHSFYMHPCKTGLFLAPAEYFENFSGDYLTLVFSENSVYKSAYTFRIKERVDCETFEEASEVMRKFVRFCLPQMVESYMRHIYRVYETSPENAAVVFNLERIESLYLSDPPIGEYAKGKIAEFEADEKGAKYLAEISKVRKLSPEEEAQTALKVIEGDNDSRRILAESYLRDALEIAKHYLNPPMTLMELVQEGNLGIIKAIEGLDSARIPILSEYINSQIKKQIIHSCSTRGGCVFKKSIVERINDFKQANKKLTEKNGRPPSEEELSKELNWSLAAVYDFMVLLD